jgi:aminoglycoside phosphotransferase (APT) family kinase protein
MKMFSATVKELLRSLAIDTPVLLGEGSESQTYRYTNNKVVKIYKSPVSVAYLRDLSAVYSLLAAYNLPFAIPEMYEIRQYDEVVYLIEKWLAGRPITAVYQLLDARQRQRLLQNYFEALTAFKTVTFDTASYGPVMRDPDDVAEYQTWHRFICETAPRKLPDIGSVLHEDGIDVDHVLAKFEQDVQALPRHPQKNFVHGDYFFGNVLVNDRLEISAVLDVSPWSVVGDHLMDIAGAVMFLDLYDYVSQQDRMYITDQALHVYGEDLSTYIQIYRVYYSLLLSDCKSFDPPAYYWSLRNLRNYLHT